MDDTSLNGGQRGRAGRRRAAGGADRPQRARAAHRLDDPQGARPPRGRAARRRADRAARAQGRRAAARRAGRPARPLLPDPRRVGGGVAVPGVPPLGARPRPRVVPAVVATRRGRRPPGVAVAGVGAPPPGRGDRAVGLVSRPRRPPHDGPARRRRPVQRLRRPPLRRTPSTSCRTTRRPRGCSNPRSPSTPSTPARAQPPTAPARTAGQAREHTIRRSR